VTDLIGALIGMLLIGFLLSPIILAVYMLANSKIDIDGDGKEDVPYRWNQ
jgi:uroporphyrinogen-III decarboxylase